MDGEEGNKIPQLEGLIDGHASHTEVSSVSSARCPHWFDISVSKAALVGHQEIAAPP